MLQIAAGTSFGSYMPARPISHHPNWGIVYPVH